MEGFESECASLIKAEYVRQGLQNISARHKHVKVLLEKRKLPTHAWDDFAIEQFLLDLATMDR
jgi:hypothetical protein